MKILPVRTNYYTETKRYYTKKEKPDTQDTPDTPLKNVTAGIYTYPSFGYCEPHMRLMRSLNESIEKSLKTNFAEYSKTIEQLRDYKSKLKYKEELHQKAAQMITQYANWEYSMAEVIPSYALECASDIMKTINQTRIFETPQDILLTIANVPKLKSMAGIDKNTGKQYTKEQERRSRANSQLYSTVILLDMLDKSISVKNNISKDEKNIILNMRNIIYNKINSIYGKNAYERIQKLKMMGKDASIDDKRASLKLLQDFDSKAQDLNLGADFYKQLDILLKHSETFGSGIESALETTENKVPVIMLSYHTHPQTIGGNGHAHTHEHEHEHDYEHEHEHEELDHEYMHAHNIEHHH